MLAPESLTTINYQNPALQDLGNSGIDEALGLANCKVISGLDAFYLIYDKALEDRAATRTNSGAFNTNWRTKYDNWEKINNCLLIQGVNPFPKNKTDSSFGTPRIKPIDGVIKYFDKQKNKEKIQKYFSPSSSKPTPFFANVPKDTCPHIWLSVAARHGVPKGFLSNYDNFWSFVLNNPIPIHIVEGEKKSLALLSIGVVAVSIPGIWMGLNARIDDQNQGLREWLKVFDMTDRKIKILFDSDPAGDKRRTVGKAAFKLASRFRKADVEIFQFWDIYKGVDDYLVAGNNYSDIQFKSFFEIKTQHQKFLSLVADLEVNQRYLQVPLPETGIVGLVSPTGTGKTTFVSQLCERNKAVGKRTFIYTHRTALGGDMSKAYGLPYQDESGVKHWDELGCVRCINSCRYDGPIRISKDMFIGADLIFEESVSGLGSLLRDSTLKPYRAKVLKTLVDEFNTALDSGGRLILIDAKLDDVTINWFRNVCPGFSFHLIKNNWLDRSAIPAIKVLKTKTPTSVIPLLFQWIKDGEKILVCTGAQKASSPYGTTGLKNLIVSKYPELEGKILVVDQRTMEDSTSVVCAGKSNFDKLFLGYPIVLVSPSVTSGVSLDTPHFTKQLQICQGNLSVNDALQQNGRVRYPIGRYLWASKVGIDKSIYRNCTPQMVLQNRKSRLGYNLQYLRTHGHELGLELDFGIHEKTAIEFTARDNALKIEYRENLIAALKKDGYRIEDFDGAEDSKEIAKVMKMNSLECVMEESQQVAESEEIDDRTANAIESSRSKTYAESCSLEKHKVKTLYKVLNPDTNFIALLKLAPKLYSEWRTHWIAETGVKVAVDKDLKAVENFLYVTGDERPYALDLKLDSFRHAVIDLFKLTRFLDEEKRFTKDSPEVLDLVKFYRENFETIRDNLGLFGITKKTLESNPIAVLQALLRELFGLKLKKKKVKVMGVSSWLYGGVEPSNKYENNYTLSLRRKIFTSWTADWLERKRELELQNPTQDEDEELPY